MGEGEAEGGDVVVDGERVFEVALVEDVAFGRLDEEENAEGEWRGGFGGAVCLVGG